MLLRRGSTGPEVAQLQALLRAAIGQPDNADGDFGAATEKAIIAFQKAGHIQADGMVNWPSGETADLLHTTADVSHTAGSVGPVAGANFYQSVIRSSPEFRSTNRCSDITLLEPVTRAAVLAILLESAAAGMPLMVFETFRSQERQALLFAQGATQLRTVGVHHYGLAADLVKSVGGQPSWKGSFDFLWPLAQKHGLIWGGNWGTPHQKHTFIDADHVQRCMVVDQPKLFDGTWYPDAHYLVPINPQGSPT